MCLKYAREPGPFRSSGPDHAQQPIGNEDAAPWPKWRNPTDPEFPASSHQRAVSAVFASLVRFEARYPKWHEVTLIGYRHEAPRSRSQSMDQQRTTARWLKTSGVPARHRVGWIAILAQLLYLPPKVNSGLSKRVQCPPAFVGDMEWRDDALVLGLPRRSCSACSPDPTRSRR